LFVLTYAQLVGESAIPGTSVPVHSRWSACRRAWWAC